MGIQFYPLTSHCTIIKLLSVPKKLNSNMSKILFSCIFFVAIGLSSAFVVKREAEPEPSVCPGSSSCSKCADFNGDSVFGDCDNSCNMCPLCALFYVKPGCDYCKKGVDACKKDCKEGMAICDKCTKFC